MAAYAAWLPLMIQGLLHLILIAWLWNLKRKYNKHLKANQKTLTLFQYWGTYKYVIVHSFDVFSDVALIIDLFNHTTIDNEIIDAQCLCFVCVCVCVCVCVFVIVFALFS